MFDLEQAILDWRRQMLAAGIQAPVPLEELENHLREEIERRAKSGLNEQDAYKMAARQIGRAPELEKEFKKINAPMEIQKVIKLAGFICAATALGGQLFICAPVVFAIAFTPGGSLGLIARVFTVAGWAIAVAITMFSWKYNHQLLPAIRNPRPRRAIGFACYAGCLLWIRFVLFHLPGSVIENISLFFLAQFLFESEWVVIAVLGGIGHGLEKAACRQKAMVNS